MYVETSKTASALYGASASYSQTFDTRALLSSFKRNRAALLLWAVICTAVAVAYILATPAEYTAYTQIILETPKRPHLLVDADGEAYPIDSAQADSRIQVIKSERLLRFVFDTLHVASRTPDIARKTVVPKLGSAPSPGPIDETSKFLDFMDRVSVRRIGISYVVEVAFRASDPKIAASTVNSITSAYIRDLVLSTSNDSQVMQRRIFSVAHDADILLAAVKDGTVPKSPIVGIDARVIGIAIVPLHKSAPHTTLSVVFAIIVALITGSAAIFFLHNRDRTFRSTAQARQFFGADLLAVISRSSGQTRLRADVELIVQRLPAAKSYLRLGIGAARGASVAAFLAKTIANRFALEGPTSLILTNRRAARADAPDGSQIDDTGLSIRDFAAGHFSVSEVKGQIEDRREIGPVVVGLPSFASAALPIGISKSLDGVLLVVLQDETDKDEIDLALAQLKSAKVGFIGFVYVKPASKTSSLVQELQSVFMAIAARIKQFLPALPRLSRA